MRIAKSFTIPVLAMALIFSVVPLFSAQEPAQPQTASPATAADQQVQKGREEAGAAKKDVKETEEGDESAVFRHSSSVKLIARLFGFDPNKESDLDKAFWICMTLNFIVVFGVLWFLLRKAVPAMFRNRNEAIQKRLEEARKTSEEARQRLAQVESRLSRLDTEIEQMRREAEAGALAEEKRVMEAAEEEHRRFVDSAEQEIARAASAARRELKAYAAELAVDLAEKRIHITENVDQNLVRDFTSQLGKDGH
jgi:F-type H+-transporting ATPase subunit b